MQRRVMPPHLNEHRRRLYNRFLDRFERALRIRESEAARARKAALTPAPAHERCTSGRPARSADDPAA